MEDGSWWRVGLGERKHFGGGCVLVEGMSWWRMYLGGGCILVEDVFWWRARLGGVCVLVKGAS